MSLSALPHILEKYCQLKSKAQWNSWMSLSVKDIFTSAETV